MAIDVIKIDASITTATQARALLNLVTAMRVAYDQVQQVLRVMSHLNDGSNFAQIEAQYGLAAGQGQVLFNLVNGTKGSMEGVFQVADAKTLTERVIG
jgi:hypothetical protein